MDQLGDVWWGARGRRCVTILDRVVSSRHRPISQLLEALVMIARTGRFALVTFAAVVSAVATAPLDAQQTGPTQVGTTGASAMPSAPAGPSVDRAAVGARPLAQKPATLSDAEAAIQSRLGLGQARALMIVGFAAVIIGLLMDNDPGTLIAVGGAVVGLYGLYHYLR
jgi:hypothetical protein